ncbi:MAG: hypothetical protein QOE45_2767 [Frankiaceae bacterium]|jgi:hypothetical protein|nr:hypothetical protein [Frankiaceae bacterium]
MRRSAVAVAVALTLLGAACKKTTSSSPLVTSSPVATSVPATTTAPPTTAPPSASPTTVPATPRALRSQAPIQGCVNGWKEPAQGTALRTKPLDLLRETQGFTGSFQVVDLRYFTGPDDANLAADSKQPSVERWYGKVVYLPDPSFKLRFIAVRRGVGEGIVAVANYGTKNFAGHDWYGFDGEGGKSKYPTVPGLWPGQPIDYTAAHELPDEVIGCLAE